MTYKGGMTDEEAAEITRAFKRAMGLPEDQPLPEQPPTEIVLSLRAEAHAVLVEFAEFHSVPLEQIAENMLASRLRVVGKRMWRKRDSYRAHEKA
jgi:hypothetical protein